MTSPRPYEHIVFTEFEDAEGILVDLNTKKYYQLNETATLIWKSLEKGLATRQIAAKIVSAYDVTLEPALASVEKTVREFEAYKLIGVK